MDLHSMHLTPAEQKEEVEEYKPIKPDYPWGLSIDLNDDSLEKLGIKTLPSVGEVYVIMAKAVVRSVGSSSSQDGDDSRHMCLQITDMGIATDVTPAAAATALYGSSES